ncbi:hypothetical protein ES705_39203 [subsurface metagenome]
MSTTAPFKYHNDGVSPVPPPDPMYQLNAIDPEYYTLGGGLAWSYQDVSRDVPEDATGALLWLWNSDSGTEVSVTLKKPGANHDNYQPMLRNSGQSVIVGLDSLRRFQSRSEYAGRINYYVMGYTGRNVVFPDDPIDIKPTVNNAYQTKDIHAVWPGAVILLTDLGSYQTFNSYHSIRPLGSTKEFFHGSQRKWPFCHVPAGGKIQTKLYKADGPSTQWLAYAYFKDDCSGSLNGISLDPFDNSGWQTKPLGGLHAGTRFSFIEVVHTIASGHLGAKKMYSYWDGRRASDNHTYFITHVWHTLEGRIFCNTGTLNALLIAETH